MKENNTRDIDLDVISFGNSIEESSTESVIYLRAQDDGVFVCYNGMTDVLVNSVISAMNSQKNLYDIISAAVCLFEEDSIQVTEENNGEVEIGNVFEQYNLLCAAMVTMFAEKHGVEFDSWAGGVVGSKAVFGKYAVLFNDLVYDLEEEMPCGVYWQFVEEGEENYKAYCEWLENNSIYCDKCDTLVSNEKQEWLNDTPACCYCGNKLEL